MAERASHIVQAFYLDNAIASVTLEVTSAAEAEERAARLRRLLGRKFRVEVKER